MPTQPNTPIHLSANHFTYQADTDLEILLPNSVLSPSGRTLFIYDQDENVSFLAVNLMTGRATAFQVFDIDEFLLWTLHPIDDHTILAAFQQPNTEYDDYDDHGASNDPDAEWIHYLRCHRLDYAEERAGWVDEWECEMHAQQDTDVNMSHATLVRLRPPHYESKHLHFVAYVFDHRAGRYHRIRVRFPEPNLRLDWSEKFFDGISSRLSPMRNGQFYAFSTELSAYHRHDLSELLDGEFKDLFHFDIAAARIRQSRSQNTLGECLAECNDHRWDPFGKVDADGHWTDDRFFLKLELSIQVRGRAFYLAVFELQTLRWRRLFVDTSLHPKLLGKHQFKMCTIDHGVLVLYRENPAYKLVTRQSDGESATFYLKSVDVFRASLRKPDSLKVLTRLEVQRVYSESWTKWRQISNAFQQLLE